MGKAGAQWGIFAAEAEGPMASAGAIANNDGFGAFTEASLGRAEGKVGPVRARLEPNINTGIGIKDGQFSVRNMFSFPYNVMMGIFSGQTAWVWDIVWEKGSRGFNRPWWGRSGKLLSPPSESS